MALVLFNDVRPEVPENLWYKHYVKLIDSCARIDDRIPPDRLRHEAILLGSPFNQQELVRSNAG
jgi:hypothetical protein